MKIYLITPVDIKYSYRGTEYYIYEYAKYLKENGKNAQILITNTRRYKLLPNYDKVLKKYSTVPKTEISCNEYILPLKWHIFVYKHLPKDGAIYFPYGIYDYLFNILFKPKGQKYVIGSHSMHLKASHIIKDHRIIEILLNQLVKAILYTQKKEKDNIYFHVVNAEQKTYLTRSFNINPNNIFYIPNFIDSKIYSVGKNISKILRVVHIGGVDKDANIVVFMIEELNRRHINANFEFYFIGQNQPKEAIELSKNYANIHVLGAIDEKEKGKLLSSMDVMIVPANETFSLSMLEGLASGLQIVANSANPAAAAIIKFGAAIYLVKQNNIEEYINVLNNLCIQKRSVKKFNYMRKINHTIAANEFDKSLLLRKIKHMFDKIEINEK